MNFPGIVYKNRKAIEELFTQCRDRRIAEHFSDSTLNEFIPGLCLLRGCTQGMVKHFEGDVGVHTALVYENLHKTAERRCNRLPDLVEQVAALIHDLKKPETRLERENGDVAFPGHEALAAEASLEIAARFGFTPPEAERLFFVVANHGLPYPIEHLPEDRLRALQASPHVESLALLQEADALSILDKDEKPRDSAWNHLMMQNF